MAVEEKNHLSPVTCHYFNQTEKILSINSTKYLFFFCGCSEDSAENLNVSRLVMSSKAAVGVLKPARVRARNSAKHQEVGGYYPVGGSAYSRVLIQDCCRAGL